MKEYKGSLSFRKELPDKVAKAYRCYKNQKTRCSNKKVKAYKDYGEKGISVEYSPRQLVQWFLDNYDEKEMSLEEVTIGRIDHDKNYSLDNIEIQTRSDNSKEMLARCKESFTVPLKLLSSRTKETIAIFESQKEASEVLKINKVTLSNHLRKHKFIYFKHNNNKYILRS
ncbi:MAG: hypothetical protein ACO2ZP_10500 [Bacteriovoracaceae bacterium]